MNEYIVYDQDTGGIIQSGTTANLDDVERQYFGARAVILKGVARGSATHVLDGAPVTRQTKKGYGELRAAAYPAVNLQLEAIAELANALRDQGIELPVKTTAWLESLRAVKAAHPKSQT